ncbi:acetyl-CoA carboxylase biotin carboxyl carrier protein [Alkalibaculum bacchi]|uniref:acetyl-CoA carboxylase biotin carboxyl carrier protein n=1 Tax=Alkalibaculum bacchi TaxID=645887 RepID=UPI0026EBF2B8|nr:acetyl-CoA carboxylase biotin carboxyl carrier protein [Alkalibaculum bacchi]
MNVEDIIKLIDKVDTTGITELKIKDDDFKLYISKNSSSLVYTENSVPIPNVVKQDVVEPILEKVEPESANENDTVVKSPLVGIYYESSDPEVAPFVSVGQKVQEGDVLCIIEAMKIFNEIKSPTNGIIKKILPSNLEVIEYDQELFIIGDEE